MGDDMCMFKGMDDSMCILKRDARTEGAQNLEQVRAAGWDGMPECVPSRAHFFRGVDDCPFPGCRRAGGRERGRIGRKGRGGGRMTRRGERAMERERVTERGRG